MSSPHHIPKPTSSNPYQVRFSTCATCGRYNKMIDAFVIPQLKQVYGINMIRVPQAAADAVVQVETQIAQGVTNGSIDMIWINLEVRYLPHSLIIEIQQQMNNPS